MEMTRERISFTFDPRDMLSFQIGFSFVRAAEACAILERTSGFEPLSETTAPRYLKLVTRGATIRQKVYCNILQYSKPVLQYVLQYAILYYTN